MNMIKKAILPIFLLGISLVVNAQSDTLVIAAKKDTVQIGSILIVNKKEAEDPNFKTVIKIGDASFGKPKDGNLGWVKGDFKKTKIEIAKGRKQLKNIETNWWTLDLGFANYHDKSPMTYWLAANQNILPYGPTVVDPKSFSLNNKKSSNVNIWVVQQKMNLYQHKINLKYGVGLEMFNFRFEKSISFREDFPGIVKYDDVVFSKNKLLVKYLTIPVQISFKPNPSLRKGFYASVGMSAGYLLNAKNKQISAERGKEEFEGNFNLNDWLLLS